MEMLVKCVINFVLFPIVILGLSAIVTFYESIKRLIKNRPIDELEKKVILETVLVSIGAIFFLSILRWKLPALLPTDLLHNIFPNDQYTVAIIGNTTLDIHSLFFYFTVVGFIFELKEFQYGRIPRKLFIRKNLLPMAAISIVCTFVPSLLR